MDITNEQGADMDVASKYPERIVFFRIFNIGITEKRLQLAGFQLTVES